LDKLLFEIPVSVAIERISLSQSRKFSYLYKGVMYEISISDTAKTVARNPRCCFCGAEATKAFVVEQAGGFGIRFFTEKNGELILFTKDHKIPKSKGGRNRLNNYQTCCEVCNRLKGNISRDNEVSKCVIEMRKKVSNQKNYIIILEAQNKQLKKDLADLQSIKIIKFYLFLRKFFTSFIDKVSKV
jgi:hypothetical protein